MALGLVAVAAVGVVLVQRWSWWGYHVLLPAVPTCVLAAYTWPAVWHRVRPHLSRGERMAVLACVPVALAPIVGHGANAYLRLARHGGGLTADGRAAARTAAGLAYREADEAAARLAARPGSVFVAGDPLVYWRAGRRPAVAVNGWAMELYDRELRARLTEQLRDARPAAIFIAGPPHGYDRLIRNRYPELQAWLDAEYAPAAHSAGGTWYDRTPP